LYFARSSLNISLKTIYTIITPEHRHIVVVVVVVVVVIIIIIIIIIIECIKRYTYEN